MKQILINFVKIFIRTKKINSFTNIIKCNIQFPKKILFFKKNNISGKVKLGEGISLYNVNISGNIQIGDFCSINGPNTFLVGNHSEIRIGNFCSIARNVQIQGIYHNYNRVTTYSVIKSLFNEYDKNEFINKGTICIEDDVWIGANSVILSGIRIGRGSIIAAGSIVTKDVEPYSIVAGNPSKLIRKRFSDESISELEKTKWWEWSEDEVKRNRAFFEKYID